MTRSDRRSSFSFFLCQGTNHFLFSLCQGANHSLCYHDRPRTVDSCRGDNAYSCWFDEGAFMTSTMWTEFAFPLLAVKDRIFTLATTPPKKESFFAKVTKSIIEHQASGNSFMTSINYTTVCEDCILNGKATECCHKLDMVPAWKSVGYFFSYLLFLSLFVT
jgi:hypothetical protein